MPTTPIRTQFRINLLQAPPPAGQPFLVFTPPILDLGAGQTKTVTVEVNDGNGNRRFISSGETLVPFWGGPNAGIQVFTQGTDQLKFVAPAAFTAVPGGATFVMLDVELRGL